MAGRRPAAQTSRVIGKALRKIDATAKVTGKTKFADDLALPRMLWCKLLRSPHPHAAIVRIDTSRALAADGVKAVLTGRELPIPFGILPVSQDEHALCPDRVRFVGDPVAAVAAVTEEDATAALDLIDVEYRVLPAIGSAEEAVTTPEPRIHEYGDHGNLHKLIDLEFGDVAAGFAEADLVREDFSFFGGQHAPADGAARGARRLVARRQAHAVVVHPDAALRAPRAGQGAGARPCPHSRDRHPERWWVRRQKRSLQS